MRCLDFHSCRNPGYSRGWPQTRTNNLLKNAPHTALVVTADDWNRPSSREQAAFPAPWVKTNKLLLSVSRIDEAYVIGILVRTCPPVEAYQS